MQIAYTIKMRCMRCRCETLEVVAVLLLSLSSSSLSYTLGLRQPRWSSFSRFIPSTSTPLHATPTASIQRQNIAPSNNEQQSMRSAIRTIRKGTGGYIQDVRYSQFLKLVNKRRIERVTFSQDGTQLVGHLRTIRKQKWFSFKRTRQQSENQYRVRINYLPNDPTLLTTLTDYNIDISVASSNLSTGPRSVISTIFRKLLVPISIFAGLFFLFRRSGDSSLTPLAIARMKPSFNFYPATNVTFEDIAGCDGAKLELAEIVDFLKQPESYSELYVHDVMYIFDEKVLGY